MAGCDESDLPDAMGALSVVNDCGTDLGLDDNIGTQRSKIENDYESIFSWDIQRLTGVKLSRISKVRDKLEIITDMEENNDVFKFNRFYLQLIACYELYISKSFKESYFEIEMVVKFMETCKLDESKKEEQYFDAYYHIALATIAYIGLTLKIDSKKLLNDIKQINNFNSAEKAAICAVKARVFMEYSPKGNDIALNFADQARALHPTEPELIIIWLKAKGRVRRYYDPTEIPGDDEIEAAESVCSIKSNSKLIFEASQIYKEVGYIYKTKKNYKESNKFFKLSFDIAK
ncbi:unnamed protein product [Macrosiphum euphorbiae]|uniref:Uncharacterized protein n=1 Tax=Macrosiphum euphorbiae TaxID=13131 RepID=A0AAV0W0R8_9HEMI|nr:unnamed protein product [Macrosiphum euphorbiae]